MEGVCRALRAQPAIRRKEEPLRQGEKKLGSFFFFDAGKLVLFWGISALLGERPSRPGVDLPAPGAGRPGQVPAGVRQVEGLPGRDGGAGVALPPTLGGARLQEEPAAHRGRLRGVVGRGGRGGRISRGRRRGGGGGEWWVRKNELLILTIL